MPARSSAGTAGQPFAFPNWLQRHRALALAVTKSLQVELCGWFEELPDGIPPLAA